MDKRFVDKFRKEALAYLKEGRIVSLAFSRATYQIEVKDLKTNESVWAFLQFDENATLKDAFCSCEEEEVCAHLAAAFLRIYNEKSQPLHIRYEHSFFNALCKVLAEHFGYEPSLAAKVGDVSYKIETQNAEVKALFFNRPVETPETSLKFSNLSQEEILHWKEGRASPALRFELSFWADFAKWLYLKEDEGVSYQFSFEEREGLPLDIEIVFPDLKGAFSFLEEDLPSLVKPPFKIHKDKGEPLSSLSYDPQTHSFAATYRKRQKKVGKTVGQWIYVQGEGFYPADGNVFLEKMSIEKALELHHERIGKFLPLQTVPQTLQYSLAFDKKWNLHCEAFVFKKGDIEGFFKSWVLVAGTFYPVANPLFETKSFVVTEKEVASFIASRRGWLAQQPGFSIHLSSIETTLTFRVDEKGALHFGAPDTSLTVHDFGEWIYLEGQGFFSKRTLFPFSIQVGLEVNPQDMSPFIRMMREELEHIPGFFAPYSPIKQHGLKLSQLSENRLHLEPLCELNPEAQGRRFHLYSEHIYVEGLGFFEIEPRWRLRDRYLTPKVIPEWQFASFFEEEFPKIFPLLIQVDPALLPPHKLSLEATSLHKESEGGYSGSFHYVSEQGSVNLKEVSEALAEEKRYLFSSAGRLDLKQERFEWARTKTEHFSTLDLLRLDVTEGIFAKEGEAKKLLEELRHFTLPEKPVLKGLHSELRLYQQTGLDWLWFLYLNELSGLLCDDMGLGKTHQAMALLAAVLNHKKGVRFLIVAPTSVIYHWQEKLARFLPKLKVHFFHGTKRSLKRLPKTGVLLTSYGILRLERKRLEKIPFEIAIFDELQVAKNPQSLLHEALLHIRAKMRLGMSGTPIENNLRELKALFDITLPGYMPSEAHFRDFFLLPIEKEGSSEKKQLLSRLIKPLILRRKKRDVLSELPEKTEDKSYADLSEEQERLYKETLEKQRKTLLADLQEGQKPIPYIHIFSVLSSLKQVCNHPALALKDTAHYQKYSSGKWDLFVELLNEALEGEQKVVVFSQYLGMLDIIEKYLQEKGVAYAQIRGETRNRQEEMRRFQEDPHCMVFIGTLGAAGVGIDLTAASIVILYDRWWNAARENQAIDRVHRIGQKWGVQVYKLITKGTIEEKIDLLITRKGTLLEEVILADDEDQVKTFTRDELIDLLSFHADK